MKKKLTWLFVSLLSFSIGAEEFSDFQKDLNLLMNSLESCECKFIRNGAEHDPKEAREHMERKLKATDGRIQTVPGFIEHIGSKSSITGKPYLVKFADGKTLASAVWLKEKWEEISKKKNESVKTPKTKKK
ncbi:YfeK family protein [Leptospira sp. 201903071]|uniref:YfeK family protein n=1 Tax=Leptospira ainazelensis TaxID=2810034 RepID=UPI00196661BF|nr:YfeK family protein [Leptospira ainazelensis]MBM9500008.1 YfeK family protein [Leptospira ainazelensis]